MAHKPVRFIVPFAPGGGTDGVSRLICDQLGKTFGQSFVVDNKGGAGGNIGTVELARAAPDGYTLGLISVASHTINPQLYTRLPYDPDKDIIAVSRLALLVNLLGVTANLPANNVAELIALCKKSPGKYSFASSGPGSSLHLSGELFKVMAGVDIIHVPYKGAGAAYGDLISGTVNMMFANMPSMLPQVHGGKVKGLGVTSIERSAAAPDIPAIAETLPGYVATSWYGLWRAGRDARANHREAGGGDRRGAGQSRDPEALEGRSRPRHAARRPRRLRRIPRRRPQGLGAGPEGVRREARLGSLDRAHRSAEVFRAMRAHRACECA